MEENSMTKLHLDLVEWWPIFLLKLSDGWNDQEYPPGEFTKEELADLKRVAKEFSDWQAKIADKFGVPLGAYSPAIIEDE